MVGKDFWHAYVAVQWKEHGLSLQKCSLYKEMQKLLGLKIPENYIIVWQCSKHGSSVHVDCGCCTEEKLVPLAVGKHAGPFVLWQNIISVFLGFAAASAAQVKKLFFQAEKHSFHHSSCFETKFVNLLFTWYKHLIKVSYVLFYSEATSIKASHFAVFLQAFYTEAKPLKHSSIVCAVELHQLNFIRVRNHGLALGIQPIEFSPWNMNWTCFSVYGMLWWSKMELKCTQWDCKSVEYWLLVPSWVYTMKNCCTHLFSTQFGHFGDTVSCPEF